jgi:hypothetical protein
MLKMGGTTQAGQVAMLAGQSFTVGKTVATGDGLTNWLFLHPVSGLGPAGEGMVALKMEGARQAGQLSALAGQTVTIGKTPIGAATAGKWLVLHPSLGGTAAKGAMGAGVAMKGGCMQQIAIRGAELEGPAAQKCIAAGFVNGGKGAGAMAAGKGAMAAGKGGAAAGACVTAGAGAGTGAVASKAAMAGKTAVMGSQTVATTAGAGAAVGGAKGIAAGGTIWTGTGTSLGLGLGLGAWGPVLLVAAAAAVGVGIYSYMKRPIEETEIEEVVN